MSLAKTHENYSHDWWTPDEWLEWVTETFGGWHFDPCPRNWEGEWSGLDVDWNTPTYVNHPGSRGSAVNWWGKAVDELRRNQWKLPLIWCAFSVEQLRHMKPSPFTLPGWLVLPESRIAFIRAETGEVAKSPANWTVFWTTVPPAETPVPSLIVRTGS